MYLTFDLVGNLIEAHEDDRPNSHLAPEEFDALKWNCKLVDNVVVVIADDELDFESKKEQKKSELKSKYIDQNIINIVNGVSFTALLQGDWYNTGLEKRKASALSRQDKLVYIPIDGYYTTDEAKVIHKFEGALPLTLINIQDAKWDEIALKNNRWLTHYTSLIDNAKSKSDLDFEINFEPVQTINMNEECQSYLDSELCSDSDRVFLISKKDGNDFHIFIEMNPNNPLPFDCV